MTVAGGDVWGRVVRGGAGALAAVVALAGCTTDRAQVDAAELGAVSAPRVSESAESAPTPSSDHVVTFEACERTSADLATTNLRPNRLTEADRALAGDLARLIPDGTLVVEPATDLVLEDGRLAFGAGYEAAVGAPLAEFQQVADGRVVAPVTLLVLDSPSEGRRVAFVEVRLSPDLPIRWEEVRELGFGTDGGDGGIVASQALELSWEDPRSSASFDAYFPGGEDVGNVCVLRMTDGAADVVLFSSGWGDGGYPTYAGYDAGGDLVSLVSHGFVVPWVLSGLPGTPPVIEGEPQVT